jgi:chromate transporter
MAIGIQRAGLPGAAAAWLGFTAPSAVAMILFAYGVQALGGALNAGVLHGLKVVAAAVVAQAVWAMAQALVPDRVRAMLCILAAIAVSLFPGAAAQVATMLVAGLVGWRVVPAGETGAAHAGAMPIGRRTAWAAWLLFFGLLLALPIAARISGSHALAMADSFYRAGSLVFGGGHVLLPLLQAEVVAPGWVSNDAFLAGYGAAQAVPGPLTTFAAYLGTVMQVEPNGWPGGLLCLVAVFLPSFLLVVGALPFWHRLRGNRAARAALAGVNAAVVGLLLAALYDPVWTEAIRSRADFALALGAFLLLAVWKVRPWLVVVTTAAAAGLLQ